MQVVNKPLDLKVNAPLVIVTQSLPSAVEGVNYFVTLQASGGVAPYVWSLAAGSSPLPAGLTLDPGTGNISGSPTVSGDFALIVQVADAS